METQRWKINSKNLMNFTWWYIFLKYVSTNQSNIHQNLNEFELISKHAFEPQYIPERGLAELTGVIDCFGRTAARRSAPFEIKIIWPACVKFLLKKPFGRWSVLYLYQDLISLGKSFFVDKLSWCTFGVLCSFIFGWREYF